VDNFTSDARAIEQRLLELAYTTDTKLTATALAYFAPCAIADASKVLEDLAARGQLTMEVEDDGAIVYAMPGRQKLAQLAGTPPVGAQLGLRREIVPVRRAKHGPSPAVAAVLSAVVPGAGHIYTGHIVAALMWFMVVGIGYAFVLPGLLLHMWCMLSAARHALPAPRRPMLLVA
jgi:hypothetical protein